MLESGTRLGPYRIERPIGAGGMGEVYRAVDTRLNRHVAIKTSHEKYSDRFNREMRAIAALNHPNICSLFDVGPDYLVMEMLDGEPLASRLRVGPLSIPDAVDIAVQMAQALEAAHAKGVIHRDIKPANVFLVARNHVKVLDFGLAKLTGDTDDSANQTTTLGGVTAPGQVMGTVAYMSPEQARGEALDHRTDLWSLGAVLYEMLSGVRPFAGATSAVLFNALLSENPAPPSARNAAVPAALDGVVAKMLEKDRELRYQSASDVIADLKRARRDAAGIETPPTGPARSTPSRARWVAATVAGALVLAIAGYWYSQRRSSSLSVTRNAQPEIVVVSQFTDTTGTPGLDGTLREALVSQLQKSNVIVAMSGLAMRRYLSTMQRPISTAITPEVANEICIRARQKATLGGSIALVGNRYDITLTATNCQNGDVIGFARADTDSKDNLLRTLATAADDIRARLGESLENIHRPGVMSIPVSTSSLDAFQAYSAGLDQVRRGSWDTALEHFQHAAEIDPTFAMAVSLQSAMYANLGNPEKSLQRLTRAFELRTHAGEHERLLIEADYYWRVEGSVDKARVTLERMLQLYPNSVPALIQTASLYRSIGELDRAIELHKANIRIDPTSTLAYSNLMSAYLAVDRLSEARQVAEVPEYKTADPPDLHLNLQQVALFEGNRLAAEHEVNVLRGNPAEAYALAAQIGFEASRGRFAEADRLAGVLDRVAGRYDVSQIAANARVDLAVRRSLLGQCDAASRVSLSSSMTPQMAQAIAICGEPARAQQILAELSTKLAHNDAWRWYDRPLTEGAIALAQNHPQQTLDATEAAVRFSRASLMVPYLRGLAHMSLKRSTDAAAEFREVLSRRSRGLDPLAAAARIQLARALAASGQTDDARATYDGLLTLWKDADTQFPLFTDAKKERAVLH